MAEQLEKGSKLPAFRLPDETGAERTVGDLAGERGLVLYAYPKDDTPGCTIEAQDFRDQLDDFRAAGFAVAGISMDDAASHCSFRDKYALTFPLLTDPDGGFLRAIGAYGEKTLYGRKMEGVLRSTVVVDPEGTVLAHYPNVRAKGHAERVLGELGKL
jgi:thioredoxin-dependent peroxiredoxin